MARRLGSARASNASGMLYIPRSAYDCQGMRWITTDRIFFAGRHLAGLAARRASTRPRLRPSPGRSIPQALPCVRHARPVTGEDHVEAAAFDVAGHVLGHRAHQSVGCPGSLRQAARDDDGWGLFLVPQVIAQAGPHTPCGTRLTVATELLVQARIPRRRQHVPSWTGWPRLYGWRHRSRQASAVAQSVGRGRGTAVDARLAAVQGPA